MSSLTSQSSDTEVWNAYDDNASYEEDASVAKAKAFITACRILLRREPKRTRHDGEEIEFDPTIIQGELKEARAFLQSNSPRKNRSYAYFDTSEVRE